MTIPLDEVTDAADGIRRLLAAIGYRGLFDAEFKRDEATGRHKLIEVNARPRWQIGLARAAGMDLVEGVSRTAIASSRPARKKQHTRS